MHASMVGASYSYGNKLRTCYYDHMFQNYLCYSTYMLYLNYTQMYSVFQLIFYFSHVLKSLYCIVASNTNFHLTFSVLLSLPVLVYVQ